MDVIRGLARSVWFRLGVSVALLAAFATRFDFHGAGERLSGGRWLLFAAATAVLFASFVVGAARWRIYLIASDIPAAPGSVLRSYLVGTFANNFLPSQVGGDVTRAWLATRPGTRLRGTATVLVDRLTAIACLVLVGWISVATNPSAVPWQIEAALGATTALLVGGTVAALALVRSNRCRALLPERFHARARELTLGVSACVRPAVLARTAAIGMGFQGLVVLAPWLIARAIAAPIAFAPLAAALAPILVVTVLPVSIGGFGVREGGYALMLGYAGLPTTEATLISILSAAAFAIASLPGGALIALRRERPGAEGSALPAESEHRQQERGEEDLHARDDQSHGEHR